MEHKPLVTIVILCYNHAQFVEDCLESIKAQTYTNWELIIADDASKDNSVDVINNWIIQQNQLKIKIHFHTVNSGIGTMLNECLALTNGNYIKFIAADDVLHSTMISEAVGFFETNESQYGIVYTNVSLIDESSKSLGRNLISDERRCPEGWVRNDLQFSNFIPAPSVLIKKEVYDKVGLYDPHNPIDDFELWLKASRYFKFHFINKPLVNYRIHADNVSHKLDFSNDMLALLIKHDVNGDMSEGINQKIRDFYFLGNLNLPALDSFYTYPYRDKWMSFCIQKKYAYKFYRLIDKIKSIF